MAAKWNSTHTVAFTLGLTCALVAIGLYMAATYRPRNEFSLHPIPTKLDPTKDRNRMVEAVQRYARSQNSAFKISQLRLYEPRLVTDTFSDRGGTTVNESRILLPATYYQRDDFQIEAFDFFLFAGQLVATPARVISSDGLSLRPPSFVSDVIKNEKPFWSSTDN